MGTIGAQGESGAKRLIRTPFERVLGKADEAAATVIWGVTDSGHSLVSSLIMTRRKGTLPCQGAL